MERTNDFEFSRVSLDTSNEHQRLTGEDSIHTQAVNTLRKQFKILIFFVVIIAIFSLACLVGLILLGIRIYPMKQNPQEIVILHFSDFYQIEGIPLIPGDTNLGKGGLARLATIIKSQTKPTIISFGGDLFSPSAMSSFLGGPFQMIEGFNQLSKLAPLVAVAGNHEFDVPKAASETFQKFDFPWLLANLYEYGTKNPINGTKATHVISIGDLKIGFIGLGFDYRTSTQLTETDVSYEDYNVIAQQWVRTLRAEGTDLVVALTHMPLTDERLLLGTVPGIDLCLAGHDHIFLHELINGRSLVEGDIDLSTLAVITLSYIPGTKPLLRQVMVDYIIPDESIPKDPEMQKIVDKWLEKFDDEAYVVVGLTAVTLHADKTTLRCKETNVGNFVSDTMGDWATNALANKPNTEGIPVVAIMNSGGLRWASDIPAGMNLTKRTILELLPFGNLGVVIHTTGSILRKALENGVSKLPASDGRFPQISGFKFEHTCKMNPDGTGQCETETGHRVLNITLANGTTVSENTELFIVTVDFIGNGGDGYTVFVGEEQVIDSESGQSIFEIVVEKIQTLGVIAPVEDGRIIEV